MVKKLEGGDIEKLMILTKRKVKGKEKLKVLIILIEEVI